MNILLIVREPFIYYKMAQLKKQQLKKLEDYKYLSVGSL